jgi:rhodanese-related sulfurtransferase
MTYSDHYFKEQSMHQISKYKLATLAAVILLAGYSASGHSANNISPKQASTQFSEKKAIIVDVREDAEWQEHHIPGAIHIPLGQLKSRLSELEPYKNTAIITQCRSGGRSAKAADQLQEAQFTNVRSLDGGIQAWEKAGLPIQ